MLLNSTDNMNDQSYRHINLDYMDMMSDGDKDMKVVMLDMLLEELPEELQKMQSLHDAQNWDEIGSVSHKMKSTLAFVGNEPMTNANKHIELIAKSKEKVHQITELLGILTEMCPKVLEELKMEHNRL